MPGQGTKILQATWLSQEEKKKSLPMVGMDIQGDTT